MTTTAPSNPHPPASQAAHGQPPSHAARAAHGPQQPTDLFSSLLALLSPDAAPLDPLGTATAAAGAPGEDPLAEDTADSDNPLAALMAWTAPHELAPAPLAGDGSLHIVGRLRPDDWQGRAGVELEIEDVADPRMRPV